MSVARCQDQGAKTRTETLKERLERTADALNRAEAEAETATAEMQRMKTKADAARAKVDSARAEAEAAFAEFSEEEAKRAWLTKLEATGGWGRRLPRIDFDEPFDTLPPLETEYGNVGDEQATRDPEDECYN